MRVEIGNKDLFKKILLDNFKIKGLNPRGITFDSRKIQKNDVFLAFKGNKVDGHEFIPDALKNGASIVFSEKKIRHNRKTRSFRTSCAKNY